MKVMDEFFSKEYFMGKRSENFGRIIEGEGGSSLEMVEEENLIKEKIVMAMKIIIKHKKGKKFFLLTI